MPGLPALLPGQLTHLQRQGAAQGEGWEQAGSGASSQERLLHWWQHSAAGQLAAAAAAAAVPQCRSQLYCSLLYSAALPQSADPGGRPAPHWGTRSQPDTKRSLAGRLRHTAPHCTLLSYNELYINLLDFTVVHCAALCYNALYCTVMHCISLYYYAAMNCTAQHITPLYCKKLPCAAFY